MAYESIFVDALSVKLSCREKKGWTSGLDQTMQRDLCDLITDIKVYLRPITTRISHSYSYFNIHILMSSLRSAKGFHHLNSSKNQHKALTGLLPVSTPHQLSLWPKAETPFLHQILIAA